MAELLPDFPTPEKKAARFPDLSPAPAAPWACWHCVLGRLEWWLLLAEPERSRTFVFQLRKQMHSQAAWGCRDAAEDKARSAGVWFLPVNHYLFALALLLLQFLLQNTCSFGTGIGVTSRKEMSTVQLPSQILHSDQWLCYFFSIELRTSLLVKIHSLFRYFLGFAHEHNGQKAYCFNHILNCFSKIKCCGE